jgi:hypothetical protein
MTTGRSDAKLCGEGQAMKRRYGDGEYPARYGVGMQRVHVLHDRDESDG